MSKDAPLVWRLRHELGTLAFYVAIAIAALGAWTILRSLLEGDLVAMGWGIGLVVGGLLVMVGRRNRRKGRRG